MWKPVGFLARCQIRLGPFCLRFGGPVRQEKSEERCGASAKPVGTARDRRARPQGGRRFFTKTCAVRLDGPPNMAGAEQLGPDTKRPWRHGSILPDNALAAFILFFLSGCASSITQSEVPERFLSCGAVGNKGLQLFEVCGQLSPEHVSRRQISTSECGTIQLTKSERRYLCEHAKNLYVNLPVLDRAERKAPAALPGFILTYDGETPEKEALFKR